MIDDFRGKYRFLSNFYPARVKYDGEWYTSVEHAYQAAKTLDLTERAIIRMAATPSQAKALGKKVKRCPDFEGHKREVMYKLVRQKFMRHKELRDLLLETGQSELVEGNTWNDTYWGVCRGTGWNHLGQILMTVRQELLDQNRYEIA